MRNTGFCFVSVISLTGLRRERVEEEFLLLTFSSLLGRQNSNNRTANLHTSKPWLSVSRKPDHLKGEKTWIRQDKNAKFCQFSKELVSNMRTEKLMTHKICFQIKFIYSSIHSLIHPLFNKHLNE